MKNLSLLLLVLLSGCYTAKKATDQVNSIDSILLVGIVDKIDLSLLSTWVAVKPVDTIKNDRLNVDSCSWRRFRQPTESLQINVNKKQNEKP